ncbi:MAG: hypothetical protein M1837_001236 [Sclerophora amabilis]|nr:MAG: hypothetical protein M1837_001236 [Sclerophora amabilis]
MVKLSLGGLSRTEVMISPRPRPVIGITAGVLLLCILFFSFTTLYRPRGSEQLREKIFEPDEPTATQSLASTPTPELMPLFPEDETNVVLDYDEEDEGNGAPISDAEASKLEYMAPLANETLGFEKIFVINLPARTDKRDALTLAASLTHMKLTFLPAVYGPDVPDKAVPMGTNRTLLWETNLGSWRSHMNALREVVENGYSSALILEDDMDWDVNIHSQLRSLAVGTQYVTSTMQPHRTAISSPYGSAWDLLWVGHCGEVVHTEPPHYRNYTVHPDPTVPPRDHCTGQHRFKEYPARTRWIHETGSPVCTFAYAVSLAGAQKILYRQSLVGLDHGPFDNSLSWMCGAGELDMKCVSVTPPLFEQHMRKGSMGGDSDIRQGDPKAQREKAYTKNIVWSTRMNIDRLIMGKEPIDQFEEEGKAAERRKKEEGE